jgi:hypothetical protein
MRARALPSALVLVLGGLALIPTSTAVAAKTSEVRKTAAVTVRAHRHKEGHRLLARSPRARASIVGGSLISITQAPWQVGVFAFIPEVGALLCGGSILDSTHILTAGHCTYNPETNAPLPAGDFLVVAGASNLAVKNAEEQEAKTTGVRRHPYYNYAIGAGGGDDVAVIELKEPLNLSGPSATSIGLTSGPTPAEGASVNLTGYGAESTSGELSGKLYSLGMTLAFSRRCGGAADALFLCASTPSGSLCSGDSGSGLTTTGAQKTVVGVTDTVEVISGKACLNGAIGGFVNVAAPEIKDFIEGSETPPRAPRGGGAIIEGVLTPGHSLTCQPGNWSNNPTITVAFIDSTSEQTLQSGPSSTYPLSAADVGRTILCEVQAANAGGTGIGRTEALPAIKETVTPPHETGDSGPHSGPPNQGAGAVPPGAVGLPLATTASPEPSLVSLLSTSTTVQSNGVAPFKLECSGGEPCTGKLTLAARETVKTKHGKTLRTVTIGAATLSLAGNSTVTVKISLTAVGRGLLAADRGRLTAKLTILQLSPAPEQALTETVHLTAQKGRSSKKGKK